MLSSVLPLMLSSLLDEVLVLRPSWMSSVLIGVDSLVRVEVSEACALC